MRISWATRRLRLLVGCVVLICSLLTPAASQPLEAGVSVGESKYFLDGTKLKVWSGRSLKDVNLEEGPEEPRLLQPLSWAGEAFVAHDSKKAWFVSTSESRAVEFKLGEGKELQLTRWGKHVVLFHAGAEKALLLDSSGESTEISFPAPLKHLTGLGEGMLAVYGDREFKVFIGDSTEAEPQEHPFGDDVSVLESGQRAVLWSKNSKTLVVVAPPAAITKQLQALPSKGATALENGEFLFLLTSRMSFLNRHNALRNPPSPAILSEGNLSDAKLFVDQNEIVFLFENPEAGLTHMRFLKNGKASGGILGKESIKSIILPQPGSNHRPFLITETSLEEPKVFYDGKPVFNPKTGERVQHTVKGHVLYMLTRQGRWKTLVSEPRTRVPGAATVIDDKLVYPRQSMSRHLEGTRRPRNWKYPFPQVSIRAVDTRTGVITWEQEFPRGKGPSPARLPQEEWPALSEGGPILFTTEDNQLAALSVDKGTPEWYSNELPMDESRPLMLRWQDGLGLVATNNTTKRFILVDDTGKITGEAALSETFNSQRTYNLAGVLLICAALIIYIYIAGKKKLFIRRIAGLEALDEAVGRATEMGKPVLYVTGLADVDDIQTLASLSILSHVAKKTAEYDSSILATTSRAVTFSAAQEVVRDAFMVVGRPDSFNIESVRYISDDQFGYAAGVDGLMVREEPAANFYMGKFYAESLIFAETGYATGAIQIAGTAQANQLPFFVAACDYTLIGEELFAASAYLSQDPLQVGSLRGQDVGKAIVMFLLIAASIFVTLPNLGVDTEPLRALFGGKI